MSEERTGAGRPEKTRMTRRQWAVVLAWWGASAACWGWALWKLGAAAKRPSPMRVMSIHETDGTVLRGRLYCHGYPVLQEKILWRSCTVSQSGGGERRDILVQFDLAAKRARLVPGDGNDIRTIALAPGPEGSLTECGGKGCFHVTRDPTRTEIPLPAGDSYVGITGLAWVDGELQIVMRNWRQPGATIWAYRGKAWTQLAAVTPTFDRPEEVKLELGYRHKGTWQILFSRAPVRLGKGAPVPITLHVATTKTTPRQVGAVSITKEWTDGFRRGYPLPIDRSPGNLVARLLALRGERIVWDGTGSWGMAPSTARQSDPVWAAKDGRLRIVSSEGAGARSAHAGIIQLRESRAGTRLVSDGGATKHPLFTSDGVRGALILPRPSGGFWIAYGGEIATLSEGLTRTDAMSLWERWSMFRDNFDRLAYFSTYYEKGGAFAIASVYAVLLVLPLLWLVGFVWYRKRGAGQYRALKLAIAYVTISYLCVAGVFASEYLDVLKRI